MDDIYDLSNMNKEEARDYVAHFIQAKKTTATQLNTKRQELEKWQQRLKLAIESNRSDLESAAQINLENLQQELPMLQSELAELNRQIDELQRRLKLKLAGPEFSVDAAALLDSLESVVGEKDPFEEEFKKQDADIALEELKKKHGL